MRTLATNLKFPEGPVLLGDGTLLFAEVAGGCVRAISPDGEIRLVAETGGGPNGMAMGPDGKLYVCNNGGLNFVRDGTLIKAAHGLPEGYAGGSIQRVDLNTGAVETLHTHCGTIQLRGPNDIVFDRHGGYYFTDFGKNEGRVRDVGSVFYVTAAGVISEVVHPIANPNGIGLSPDGSTLHVAETETSRLWSYEVRGPGDLAMQPFPSPNGGRLVLGLGGYQRFDSLAVQENGDICVATLVTGKITVISPDGRLVREVQLPDLQTTNLCFGGTDMRKAYVTLSWTGQIVELDWPVPGLKLNF